FKGLIDLIMDFVVRFFWWITDYGSSTIRLISVFLIATLGFAVVYALNPQVTNDIVLNESSNPLLVFIRALYFSVIIMTGLGLGEINAYEASYIGHIIILIQSLSGYILLGAFLVRIGILFQGEFPVAAVRKKEGDHACDPDKSCVIKKQ
ncbi:MAG TPA: ion channel, partial [Lachnospiraceae bacterium]|nr:ion channel [Lachnospiraceae bacterium]